MKMQVIFVAISLLLMTKSAYATCISCDESQYSGGLTMKLQMTIQLNKFTWFKKMSCINHALPNQW